MNFVPSRSAALAQVRSEVDGEHRDEDRGDDRDDDREQAHAARGGGGACARASARSTSGVGFRLLWLLRFVHWATRSRRARGPPRPKCRRHGDFLDRAGLGRAQLVLHLHRFDDDDAAAARRRRRLGRRARARRDPASAPRSAASRAHRPSTAAPRRRAPAVDDHRRRYGRASVTSNSPRAAPGAICSSRLAFDASPTIERQAELTDPLRLDLVRLAVDRDAISAGRPAGSTVDGPWCAAEVNDLDLEGHRRSASMRAARCQRLRRRRPGQLPTPPRAREGTRRSPPQSSPASVRRSSSSLKLAPRRSVSKPIEPRRVVLPVAVFRLAHQPRRRTGSSSGCRAPDIRRARATCARSRRCASRPTRPASRSSSRSTPALRTRRSRRRRHECPGQTRAQGADEPRRRHEAQVRILGVDAAFDRVADGASARVPDRCRGARLARCESASGRGRGPSPFPSPGARPAAGCSSRGSRTSRQCRAGTRSSRRSCSSTVRATAAAAAAILWRSSALTEMDGDSSTTFWCRR